MSAGNSSGTRCYRAAATARARIFLFLVSVLTITAHKRDVGVLGRTGRNVWWAMRLSPLAQIQADVFVHRLMGSEHGTNSAVSPSSHQRLCVSKITMRDAVWLPEPTSSIIKRYSYSAVYSRTKHENAVETNSRGLSQTVRR